MTVGPSVSDLDPQESASFGRNPDPDPGSALLMQIRLRPNDVDSCGSGSETLGPTVIITNQLSQKLFKRIDKVSALAP